MKISSPPPPFAPIRPESPNFLSSRFSILCFSFVLSLFLSFFSTYLYQSHRVFAVVSSKMSWKRAVIAVPYSQLSRQTSQSESPHCRSMIDLLPTREIQCAMLNANYHTKYIYIYIRSTSGASTLDRKRQTLKECQSVSFFNLLPNTQSPLISDFNSPIGNLSNSTDTPHFHGYWLTGLQ